MDDKIHKADLTESRDTDGKLLAFSMKGSGGALTFGFHKGMLEVFSEDHSGCSIHSLYDAEETSLILNALIEGIGNWN